jgi:hypothetical protein
MTLTDKILLILAGLAILGAFIVMLKVALEPEPEADPLAPPPDSEAAEHTCGDWPADLVEIDPVRFARKIDDGP